MARVPLRSLLSLRSPLSRTLPLCTGLLVAAACVHATSPSSSSSAAAAAQAPRPVVYYDARSISFSELTAARGTTVYELLRTLRPEFLRPRYPSLDSPGGHLPAVYVDNAYEGEVEMLHSVPSTAITRIRFLTPVEAGQRFGTTHDHRGGVILVQTGRRM